MFSLAIDGPAAAGKSTTSCEVARKLGFLYVDTGAMYRSIGLYMIENNININSTKNVADSIKNIKLDLEICNGQTVVLLNGKNVMDKIRTEEVSMSASLVSANSFVREFLFDFQKKFAKEYNVVMDGRDIGTKIIPDASLKIFLTASPEQRAKRRFEEVKTKRPFITYEEILKDIIKRDDNDKTRAASPLSPAEDAVLLDNTKLSSKETVEKIITIFKSKI